MFFLKGKLYIYIYIYIYLFSIFCTQEININNKIPFLGVLIDTNDIDWFITSTYKKTTNINPCTLNFQSKCSFRYKRTSIKTLIYMGGARGVMVITGIGHGDTSSNPGLIAFHIALIPLGKVWIQLFSLQLWVNRLLVWQLV